MWHGAYLSWMEEARVEALSAAGLAYADLSASGLELPVVNLSIQYRQALLHGETVALYSWVLSRRGVKLPWRTAFVKADGSVAAEANVELVLVELVEMLVVELAAVSRSRRKSMARASFVVAAAS